MKVFHTLLIFSFLFCNVSKAQVAGDFRTATDGDWSSTSTWETFDGATWNAATGTPTSSTAVFIQDGDSVVLTGNSSCKDLHLNADLSTDVGRLNCQSFTLSVFGKLRTYTGSHGTIPGTSVTGTNNHADFIKTGTGKIQITGTTRDVTLAGEWGVPSNFNGWTLEFSMNSASDVATIKTNMRAGSIIIAAGTVTMDIAVGGALRPDNGSVGTGTLTVNSGATLNLNGTTIARTATERFSLFTLNSGATLSIPSGVAGKIAASTVTLNGTVVCNSTTMLGNGGIASAATTNTYTNLTTGTSITLSSAISVSGTLTLGGKLTTTSSNLLTMGASGSISGASSSNYIDGPLALTAASTTPTLTFQIGKGAYYRKLVLNLNHTDATPTVYTAELFNTAPTSRTLGTLTNVSSMRYWNVVKGAGSTVTGTNTIALDYGADDGISNHTSLKIAHENSTAWDDIGASGATSLAGTITSTTNFTTFGDFVLANITQINSGDFRTATDGDWSTAATWETWNGSTWVAAASTPTSSTNVYIQDGDSVVLSANSACKDLHLNSDLSTDVGRLNCQSFTLAVSGKLRTYTGSKGNVPGANSTGLNNHADFIKTGTGKIQITGTSRDVTSAGEWGVPSNFNGWTLEFAMNSASDIATIKTNLRAGAITIASGQVTMDIAVGGALRPDNGSTGTGTLTINSGATLNLNSTTIARTASERFGTFTVNAGGIVNMPSGTTCKIAASTVTINGTVISNNGSTLGNGGITSAASTATYGNFTVNIPTTLNQAITVNSTLTLNDILTTTSTNNLILGAGGTISGASASAFINGPLSIQNTNTSSLTPLTFPIGKGSDYRPVILKVTQSSGSATTYTAEMFNTVPPSRTLPGGISHVSLVRYFTISNGGPSAVTAAKATLAYEADDGVNQTSTLRILKESGANWVDLGGTGSAVTSGTIESTTNFTSFSDFVLANASGGTNPLPVTWLSFDAKPIAKNANLLEWSTASEVNNKGFEVERSFDGTHFASVKFIKGNENTNAISTYRFIDSDDELTGKAVTFYRIKQLDFNGDVSYSEVRMVKALNETIGITIFPNPAQSEVTISAGSVKGKVTVEITDLSGKTFSINQFDNTDNSLLKVNTSGLAKGSYLIRIISKESTQIRKFLIQ